MLSYLFKRILYWIPLSFAVSILSFTLCHHALHNPTLTYCYAHNLKIDDPKVKGWRAEQYFDLPLFYIELQAYAEPDTLHHIYDPPIQALSTSLLGECGEWKQVQAYLRGLNDFIYYQEKQKTTVADTFVFNEGIDWSERLVTTYTLPETAGLFDTLQRIYHLYPQALSHIQQLRTQRVQLYEGRRHTYKNYIPVIRWRGTNNQYHKWLMRFLQGDWGKTLHEPSEPVADKIFSHLRLSLTWMPLAIFFGYILALLIVLIKFYYRGTIWDRSSTAIIYFLNALPGFIVSLFILVFFASPYFLNLVSANYALGTGYWDKLGLPIMSYAIATSLPIIVSLSNHLSQVYATDFIRTAHAKGLSEWKVLIFHAGKNSLVPLLAFMAGTLSALMAGSVMIEFIFGVIGIGHLKLQAIEEMDIPVVQSIIMLSLLFTVVGYLISDFLALWVDRRILSQ